MKYLFLKSFMGTLLFMGLGFEQTLASSGAYYSIYSVGIKSEPNVSANQLAKLITETQWRWHTENGCIVDAELTRMSVHPSDLAQYNELVLISINFSVKAEGSFNIPGCNANEPCGQQPIQEYCQSVEEQMSAEKEAVEKFWKNNKQYLVIEQEIIPIPGVRIGN